MYCVDLTDRSAIVTASSRGIGRATAIALAGAGANVLINYRNDRDAAEAVVSEIHDLGRDALAVKADAANSAQVDDMVKQALARWARIDILVSNAGAGTRFAITETTDEEYRRVFDTNVKGFVALMRAGLPYMKQHNSGRIIAVSSIVGRSGKGFMSPSPTYAGAKAALLGYVKGLARECAPHRITVNAVCPGWIDWGTKHTAAPDAVRASALEQIPLGRTGTPEDVAGGILYLASDEASYLTGVSLDINGGLYMA
jgi:3-oxoacyl-[acyl-carrier protein] reductase